MKRIIVITPPIPSSEWIFTLNSLFSAGLERLHLRLHTASEGDYRRVIEAVAYCYRRRVVIHDYFHLADDYKLGGIHLSTAKWQSMTTRPLTDEGVTVSASCHSAEEIMSIPFQIDYCFLSPVYDSISKLGYVSAFDASSATHVIAQSTVPVWALGGITPEAIADTMAMGFEGVAVLGYVWNNPQEAIMRWRRLATPEVLLVGGLDPTAGAGISADIKVAEQTGSYGYNICTGVTYQNTEVFEGCNWLPKEDIMKQVDVLRGRAHPIVCKIGLIENLSVLLGIIDGVRDAFPLIRIVWDPIFASSTDFVFERERELLPQILDKIDVLTPNLPEMEEIAGDKISESEVQQLAATHHIAIVLKGGHAEGNTVADKLITSDFVYHTTVLRSGYPKHGTGCAHSTAFASAWAGGCSLRIAADSAQRYVSALMRSNESLLGYHRKQEMNSSLLKLHNVKLQFITNGTDIQEECEQIEKACRMGIRWIQLRMKEASDDEMLCVAYRAKEICAQYDALLIINDRIHIAHQSDADGVHLGRNDGSITEARALLGANKIIGATCNTFEDIKRAEALGADYVGVGPFRFTDTKKNLAPILGLEGYKHIAQEMLKERIFIPAFAIGGIEEGDISPIRATGIEGIAVSGCIIRKINNDDFSPLG